MKNHFLLLVQTLLGLAGTTAGCDRFSTDCGRFSAILHREQYPAVLLSRLTAVILPPVNPAIRTIAPHRPFGQPATAATSDETYKRPHQSRAPFSGLGGTVKDAMKNHFLLLVQISRLPSSSSLDGERGGGVSVRTLPEVAFEILIRSPHEKTQTLLVESPRKHGYAFRTRVIY
ncbi:hypothetical protein HPB50_011667 [Hyalomma asiaticum]|uniref:Uncharacterized protein n=1 Tax=Hyalomma asiaticum TaxID=266040 RepID=A0ACB7S936_HYAAI|nr:hypothetical protein HPB50_011667 [Hyalomma asiaticum]